jgi:hypothetical protein
MRRLGDPAGSLAEDADLGVNFSGPRSRTSSARAPVLGRFLDLDALSGEFVAELLAQALTRR